MRIIALLLTLSTLVGCDTYAIGNPVVVTASSKYTDDELAAFHAKVEQASITWGDILVDCIDPFPMRGDGVPLEVHPYAPDEWPHAAWAIGFVPTGEWIDVKGPTPGDELGLLVDVVTHEMGHVIGLSHNGRATSVMSPKLPLVPDAEDQRIARARLCR